MSSADNLAVVLRGINEGSVNVFSATCSYVDSKWRVYRGGLEIPVVWVESASPRPGSCLIAVDTPPMGQSTTYVIGFTFKEPFRSYDTAQVLTAGSGGVCSITLPDGTVNTRARHLGHYNPSPGNVVLLMWRGGEPYILGQLSYGHVPFPPGNAEPLPELPRGVDRGWSDFPSIAFNVWDASDGGWTRSPTREIRLDIGDSVIFTYGGATRGLSDQTTVESVTLSLGKRSQNDVADVVTFEVYRSDAEYVTASQPSILDGPYKVTVSKDQSAPVQLPAELGEMLKLGGSITVKAVSAAASFIDSPANGFLKINWRSV